MPKKRISYWSVSEIGPSPPPHPLKFDADDDEADGRVGIWKAPLPDGTAQLKRTLRAIQPNPSYDMLLMSS